MSDLDVEGLRYEVDAERHLAVVTIDRPQSKNAFTPEMWSAGAAMLRRSGGDDAVHALLLTATGEVFCAGADLKAFSASKEAGQPFHHFVTELEAFPKPVVAAVNGAGVGAGFTLLAYTDLVVASTDARFRAPFVAMGLVPEAGSSFMLPRLLGTRAVADLMYTGRWLGAEEAQRLGFVSELVDPEDLVERARATAATVAAMPLEALVQTKALLRANRVGVDQARAMESESFRRLLTARPDAT